MPSAFSHAIAGAAILAIAIPPKHRARRALWLAAAVAAMPDLDNVGVLFGAHDVSLWFGGHRGFTHSIFFALLVGAGCAALLNRNRDQLLRYWLALSAATASHGVLDALSVQGPGVAFLSPFSPARFTFGWHPLDPSGSARGQVGFPAKLAAVAGNELLLVGVPCLAIVLAAAAMRRTSSRILEPER